VDEIPLPSRRATVTFQIEGIKWSNHNWSIYNPYKVFDQYFKNDRPKELRAIKTIDLKEYN
jgi:hypothetical protein